jgi:hypothetical protein
VAMMLCEANLYVASESGAQRLSLN